MPFGTLITIGIVLLIVSIVLYALGASGTAGMTASNRLARIAAAIPPTDTLRTTLHGRRRSAVCA